MWFMISIANLIVISFKILIMIYDEKFWKQQGGRKTKGKMLSCFCESEEIFHHNWILVSYLKSGDFLHNLNSGGKKWEKGGSRPFLAYMNEKRYSKQLWIMISIEMWIAISITIWIMISDEKFWCATKRFLLLWIRGEYSQYWKI